MADSIVIHGRDTEERTPARIAFEGLLLRAWSTHFIPSSMIYIGEDGQVQVVIKDALSPSPFTDSPGSIYFTAVGDEAEATYRIYGVKTAIGPVFLCESHCRVPKNRRALAVHQHAQGENMGMDARMGPDNPIYSLQGPQPFHALVQDSNDLSAEEVSMFTADRVTGLVDSFTDMFVAKSLLDQVPKAYLNSISGGKIEERVREVLWPHPVPEDMPSYP